MFTLPGVQATEAQDFPEGLTEAWERRERQRALYEEREQEQQRRLPSLPTEQTVIAPLPVESVCHRVERLDLVSKNEPVVRALRARVLNENWGCVGLQGIRAIQARLGVELLQLGYVSSRVRVLPQALGDGVLKVQVEPGYVAQVSVQVAPVREIPIEVSIARVGQVLNVRDLEQAVDNIESVAGQRASFDITPAARPAHSDIQLSIQQSKRWGLSLDANDEGGAATGQHLVRMGAQANNLTGYNDTFRIWRQVDAEQAGGELGSGSVGVSYTVPQDYWRMTVSASQSEYRQTVQGVDRAFLSSGSSEALSLKLSKVIHRDQQNKLSTGLSLGWSGARNYINNTEILVQRKRRVDAVLDALWKRGLGRAQLDLRLAHHRGLPWFGADRDPVERPAGLPSQRYRYHTFDVDIQAKLGKKDRWKWSGSLHHQWAGQALFAAQQMGLGGRYSVRGISPERAISAERGWFARHELEASPGWLHSELKGYFAIDHGRLYGPSLAAAETGRRIGSAIGLRWRWKQFSFDLFQSREISRHDAWNGGFTVRSSW